MPRPTQALLARKALPARRDAQARAIRLDQAVQSYYQQRADGHKVSVQLVALQWGVAHQSVHNRIKSSRPRHEYIQTLQLLTPAEELALVDQIVWLQRHGFPARPEYVRHLVRGILKEKGSTHELGKDWLQKFRFRHPEVKKTMISPRDYKRAMQETRGCFQQFYNLYRKIVDDLAILPEDI